MIEERGSEQKRNRVGGTAQDPRRIANDLRGSVDGWGFKTYVLGMLFYRFISEPPLGRDEYSTTAPLINVEVSGAAPKG
jgi:hypothetical protein